jgi:hypothetical protein
MRALVVALLALAALAACAPPPGLGRATALPAGQGHLVGGLEMMVVDRPVGPEESAKLPWALLAAGYRRGVGAGVDVGGRAFISGFPGLWTWGVQADGKVEVLRGRGRSTTVSVGGALAYMQALLGMTPTHVAAFTVPVLVGHPLGRHEITWGPRAGVQLLFGEGANPVWVPVYGASVGFVWKLGRLELTPELVLSHTPISLGGEADAETEGVGAWQTQLSLGGSWRF